MAKTPKKKATLTRRSMPADDQEARSVGQFMERLAVLGWKPQGPRKDYGEDYLVQIWDDGVPSGLSFYVQLKSITNAEKRKGKRDSQTLHYKLEVKDIDHWAAHAVPVVLVIWDIEARVGYWQTIRRIVEGLEKEKPKWRQNVYVTVNVPAANTTNDEGMGRLRELIAEHFEPIIPKNEGFSFDFSFPATDDGQNAMRALQKTLDEGGSTIIDGTFITSIQYPGWYRRLYGTNAPPQSIEVRQGVSNEVALRTRVEVETDQGSASIPYVEFRMVKGGRKTATLSNEKQGLPLEIMLSLDLDAHTGSVTFTRKRVGKTPREEFEVISLLLRSMRAGSRVILIDLDGRFPTLITALKSSISSPHVALLERYYELIGKLVYIQSRVAQYGAITLTTDLTRDDALIINDVFVIMREGRREKTVDLSFTVKPSPKDSEVLKQLTDSKVLTLGADADPIELLGVSIPVGRVRFRSKNNEQFVNEFRRAVMKANRSGKPVRLSLPAMPIVEEYVDWLLPDETPGRLKNLATTQSGYFTLRQALDVGFASAEQLEIHERVERCGNGVYRFKLHPASEHEDLVITWLQTEKQGVFSHDTALALHEFSDILPARLHITVPPDWKPVEGMEPAPNVVVHHGSVAPTEMDWMGPVPFTKPLRTIEECIEKGLTSDLVTQAIDEARRRGKITHAEAERLRLINLKSA